MKKLTFLLIFTTFFYIFSQSQNQKNFDGLVVTINFTEPKIYSMNEKIYIDVKIVNRSQDYVTTLIAQDKLFSFDFEIYTMQNRKLNKSQNYVLFFNRVQPVFNSVIKLDSNEGFTYRVLLNDYYDIDFSGQYYVRCIYYPNLKMTTENSEANVTIKSNYLTLNIKPDTFEDNYVFEKIEAEKEKKLFAEKRSPDEVVEYMLNARMKSEWEKFFLYLDLDKLILTGTKFRAKYQKADIERQLQIIEEYKDYLKQSTIDEISMVPVQFRIVRTEYSEGTAKVEAILKFKQYDFIDEKFYTYILNKKGNIWYITNYTVQRVTPR